MSYSAPAGPPPLPPRSQANALDVEPDNSDAPPAYSATADAMSHEQTVDYGPSRPFLDPPSSLPPPPQRYEGPGQQATSTGAYSPYPIQNPLPGQSRPPLQGAFDSYESAPTPPPRNNLPPTAWQPTTSPVSGQVLLRNNNILVFPKTGHKQCSKCRDTGYKSSDPSNPCKKCSFPMTCSEYG